MKLINLAILSIGLLLAQGAFSHNALFQVSLTNALYSGIYHGDVTLKELLQHGNYGLGDFNGLNGEMLLINGNFYHFETNGKAIRPNLNSKVPFAVVTFFRPTKSFQIQQTKNYNDLMNTINKFVPENNTPTAFLIKGKFKVVIFRSMKRQHKPYPPLNIAAKEENKIKLSNVSGLLFGVRIPAYFRNINVVGYHFHFITKNRKIGGHLLGISIASAEVKYEYMDQYTIQLLKTKNFQSAKHLSIDRQKAQEKIEFKQISN